jgi:hypothetical protein
MNPEEPRLSGLDYEELLDLFQSEIKQLLECAHALYEPKIPRIAPPERAKYFKISQRISWPLANDPAGAFFKRNPNYLLFERPPNPKMSFHSGTAGWKTLNPKPYTFGSGLMPGVSHGTHQVPTPMPTSAPHAFPVVSSSAGASISTSFGEYVEEYEKEDIYFVAQTILEDTLTGGLQRCVRALRQLRSACAWCRARAKGMENHRQEMMRQQHRAIDLLQSEIAINALERASKQRKS